MDRTLRSAGHRALMEALKTARLDAGMTQTEVAQKLKRPQSFVAKYENGERKVEVVELAHIARAIGCSACRVIEQVELAEFNK